MRGGYQIISLKNSDFTPSGAGATVAGTFSAINYSYTVTGKMLQISDYKLGGVARPASAIRFVKSGDNYSGTITTIATDGVSIVSYDVIVTPADAVTIVTKTVAQ